MTTTISDGTTAVTPVLTLGYASNRDSRNVFHDVIGRADQDVTLYPAGLRSGTLTFLFDNETDALTCENLHSAAAVFTITDTDRPSIAMTYAVKGKIPRTLDDGTREMWTVAVDFQEVQP